MTASGDPVAGLKCLALLNYLKAYATVTEAKTEIGKWFQFYNGQRPHQALNYLTPREFFDAAAPVDMWTTRERALPTSPQAQHQQKGDSHDQEGLIRSVVASRAMHAGDVQPGHRTPP